MKQTNTKNNGRKTENRWLHRLREVIRKLLPTGELNNEKLATQIGISERHLFRRIKATTGLSPQQYVRQYRLQMAKQYLEQGTFRTVKDTAEAVGYTNVSYFISQFEKEFGQKPLEVLQEWGWR